MARGRKSLTLEEKLLQIDNQIEEYEKMIKNLKEQKKQIETEIKAKRLNELDELITASGKSFDEIKELLSK